MYVCVSARMYICVCVWGEASLNNNIFPVYFCEAIVTASTCIHMYMYSIPTK